MDVLLGYCTFQLKFFLTLVNTTKVMLAGVAASKAQTRVLCVPEMNFPCQICRHFWLHHLMTAFCFAVQHMCCCVYVNLCIFIFRRKMCEERKEKGFHMPGVGRCVSTFDLLSFSYVSWEGHGSHIFRTHRFSQLVFSALAGEARSRTWWCNSEGKALSKCSSVDSCPFVHWWPKLLQHIFPDSDCRCLLLKRGHWLFMLARQCLQAGTLT